MYSNKYLDLYIFYIFYIIYEIDYIFFNMLVLELFSEEKLLNFSVIYAIIYDTNSLKIIF